MGYEDFTTYTEVEPDDRFTILANQITVSGLGRDEDGYIYDDKDPGHFGDFTHTLDVEGSSGSTTNDYLVCWMLSNIVDDIYGIGIASGDVIGVLLYEFGEPAGNPRIRLRECDGGVIYSDWSVTLIRDTRYYIKIVKSGTSLVLGIYSTANLRDTGDGTDGDIDNLSLTLQNDYNFRYVFGVSSWNDGTGGHVASGDIWNLDLHEAAPPSEGLGVHLKHELVLNL